MIEETRYTLKHIAGPVDSSFVLFSSAAVKSVLVELLSECYMHLEIGFTIALIVVLGYELLISMLWCIIFLLGFSWFVFEGEITSQLALTEFSANVNEKGKSRTETVLYMMAWSSEDQGHSGINRWKVLS